MQLTCNRYDSDVESLLLFKSNLASFIVIWLLIDSTTLSVGWSRSFFVLCSAKSKLKISNYKILSEIGNLFLTKQSNSDSDSWPCSLVQPNRQYFLLAPVLWLWLTVFPHMMLKIFEEKYYNPAIQYKRLSTFYSKIVITEWKVKSTPLIKPNGINK